MCAQSSYNYNRLSVEMETSASKQEATQDQVLVHNHMASHASKSTTPHSIDNILARGVTGGGEEAHGSWPLDDAHSRLERLRPSSMDFLQLHLMQLRHQLLMGSPAPDALSAAGSRLTPEPPPSGE